MNERRTLDVSILPRVGFGAAAPLWWATLLLAAIETTVFVLTFATYFYYRMTFTAWPPEGVGLPSLRWGTVNLIILLVSAIPMVMTDRAAVKQKIGTVKIGLVICNILAVAFLVVRFYEFHTLAVKWNSNAYGSVVWALLSFHTVHLLSETVETVVLMIWIFLGHTDKKHMLDVDVNALYWYFIVLIWIPIYIVLYVVPRVM